MKKCIVIGGGLAGLSAAVYLSKAGIKVTLLESSQKLGGRAYSLKDNETGDIIDNGQHILMGCYKFTLELFNEIGALGNLSVQRNLNVNFLKEGFKLFKLKAPDIFYPFNLLAALLNYKALSIDDKLRFISFFTKLPFYSDLDLERLSVYEWLEKENQSENAKKSFWEILAVGALNTNIKEASAKIFADILKEIFFKGNKAAAIIIPRLGLSETYCEAAKEYIEAHDGEICFGENVIELKNDLQKIIEVKTSKRKITDFDFAVSSVQNYSFKKILKHEDLDFEFEPEYSSILSIHIWLKENPLKEKFYGLINSPVHWIFNHGKHITLVISDAGELTDKGKEEIFSIAAGELEKYTFIKKERISSFKIIKEKRATFIPSKRILKSRPSAKTKLVNFFLAGDWINTGLPSTIESAVKSGRLAAEEILNLL